MEKNYIDPSPEITELSAYQIMKGSDLTTDSMRRRDALKRQTIAAAAKVGMVSPNTPIQPYDFGNAMTDGFLYC